MMSVTKNDGVSAHREPGELKATGHKGNDYNKIMRRMCPHEDSLSLQDLLTPAGILLQTAPEFLLSLMGSHESAGIHSGMLSNRRALA